MFHVKHLLIILIVLPLFTNGQHFSTSTIEVKPMPALPVRDAALDYFFYSFSQAKALSAEAKEWFYWTNFSRSKPKAFYDSVVAPILKTFPNLQGTYAASLKRDLYQTSPLPLLRPNESLATLAQAHANDLRRGKSQPSHTSPSGVTFQSRMMSAGIRNCAGENISYGPSNTVLALVFLYIDEGIPDLGHRKSLLNPAYTEMGIGISMYPGNNYMVIQDFSCNQ